MGASTSSVTRSSMLTRWLARRAEISATIPGRSAPTSSRLELGRGRPRPGRRCARPARGGLVLQRLEVREERRPPHRGPRPARCRRTCPPLRELAVLPAAAVRVDGPGNRDTSPGRSSPKTVRTRWPWTQARGRSRPRVQPSLVPRHRPRHSGRTAESRRHGEHVPARPQGRVAPTKVLLVACFGARGAAGSPQHCGRLPALRPCDRPDGPAPRVAGADAMSVVPVCPVRSGTRS